ncbi:MAG: glycosyltransferase [Pirellulales bacterium]|nr:glycosyltransferase [Pirellulales bacterium]
MDTPIPMHRVLHVINGEHYAGAERVQDLLAQQLPSFGFLVDFACIKPGRFAEARSAQDVPLDNIPMRFRLDIRPAWKLARRIRTRNYAIVHAHSPRSLLIGSLAARHAGVPLVYHAHSPIVRDTTFPFRNWLNFRCERWCLGQVDRIIAVSPSLSDHLISSGIPPDRVTCVMNGVPGIPFDESRRPPGNGWTLGTAALFRPRKGIDVLLEALARRLAAGDNIRLRAIGPFETPEYQKEVMQLVHRLHLNHAIDWTGFSGDMPAELKKIDLFVLPSLFGEGLPMVVLEAMAAGVPVVATRVEGIPIAIRDGQEGILVPPGDGFALSQGIARIVHGEFDWLRLRKNVYRRHAEHFSARAMATGVETVYREILRESKKNIESVQTALFLSSGQ